MPIIYKFWESQPPGTLNVCPGTGSSTTATHVVILRILTTEPRIFFRALHVLCVVHRVALGQFLYSSACSQSPVIQRTVALLEAAVLQRPSPKR
jgi:hypothetical protein